MLSRQWGLAWRHPVVREWLLIALLLTGFITCALRFNWFERIEYTVYDQALALWKRPASDDIIIIGMDDASLKGFGRWPWKRSLQAALIDKMTEADVKALAVDVVYTEPDRDPQQDEILARAVRANGKVILPLVQGVDDSVDEGKATFLGEAFPIPSLTKAANRLGVIAPQIDSDGVVRKAFLRSGFRQPRHDLFALATFRLAEPERAAASRLVPPEKDGGAASTTNSWVLDFPYQVPFAGPPGHFRKVSYIDVFRPDGVPLSTFKNKIVLVGATAASMSDEFPTPLSGGSSRSMAGIEVHANILQGLREGIDIQRASPLTTALISIALVLVLLASYLWLSPRKSITMTVAMCLAVVVASVVLFRGAALWVSPVIALMAMVLAYPLWSWRKLEATQRYLDDELQRLQSERSVVGAGAALALTAAPAVKAFVPDVIEQRIASVRAAGEQLRALNRFVADSLESLPEAALVTDVNDRVVLANTSADRMFAIQRASRKGGSLEGFDVFELLANYKHDAGGTWREQWTKAASENRVLSLETRNDDDQDYLLQMAASRSQSGVLAGTVVTLTDISPLRESERKRDEALRFLSHDMRSPQASIITLLEMQREDPESMPTDKLVERIGRYAKRTLTLADDFLRLAAAERVKPADFQILELGSMLQDAAEDAWSLAQAKGMKVVTDLPEDEYWVRGDRELLTRVVMNLLSNAIKYSPPDTRVTLKVTSRDKFWDVGVADQGYGITEANLTRLFGRFVRLHQEGQPEVEGVGLGLVFVKTVVTRHNGEISVTSKAFSEGHKDHGTTFTVALPKSDPPED